MSTPAPAPVRVAVPSPSDARRRPVRTGQRKAKFERDKLAKRLRREVGRAIEDFGMIRAGDKVMVAVSGGKDSWSMLDLLVSLRARAPLDFELVAVNLDQKQPGFPADVIPDWCRTHGIPYTVLEQDTYSVVQRVVPEGKTQCGLCSRLRRGALYRHARENGFTRIALGHHRDDIIATFFLNLFHGGRLKAMPPKLRSDDGANVVIRPLAYVPEADLERYAADRGFPIIPCTLCGSQENLQRKNIRALMDEWERRNPGRLESIFRALCHVSPSQLADRALFDFAALDAPDG